MLERKRIEAPAVSVLPGDKKGTRQCESNSVMNSCNETPRRGTVINERGISEIFARGKRGNNKLSGPIDILPSIDDRDDFNRNFAMIAVGASVRGT